MLGASSSIRGKLEGKRKHRRRGIQVVGLRGRSLMCVLLPNFGLFPALSVGLLGVKSTVLRPVACPVFLAWSLECRPTWYNG